MEGQFSIDSYGFFQIGIINLINNVPVKTLEN